jgi:hypothetical protein
MLIEADKLYGGDFWRAAFGRHPIRNLGWEGFVLLAFYLVGAPAWWLVTAWLLEIGAVWRRRMGLRGQGRRAPGRSQNG